MAWQTESPTPVPKPTGLVVKNGSKIRLRIAGGTPGPLSSTIEADHAGLRLVASAIRSRRGSGACCSACCALIRRFMITCTT